MKRFLFGSLTLLSAGALVLVVVNILVFADNRAMQQVVAERQRYINESLRLNQLNSQLIQLAAETAASTGDAQLRNLLAENGITFEVTQQPGPSSVPASIEQEAGDE